MTDAINCSKCAGELTEGFVIDRSHGGAKTEQMWVEGVPETSIWSGLKTSDREVFNVRALRCANCGFLEFYADVEIQSNSTLDTLFGS